MWYDALCLLIFLIGLELSFAGFIGCVWTAIWMYVVSDSPSEDKKISQQEKQYIEDSLGPANRAVTIQLQ